MSKQNLSVEQETELIQTALTGTPDQQKTAINQLLECHRDALYQFAIRAVGDHDRADDAVQATLVFAWQALSNGKFKHDPSKPSQFRHWLLSACKNHNHRVLEGRFADDKALYKTKDESGALVGYKGSESETIDLIDLIVSTDLSPTQVADVTEADVEIRKMMLILSDIPADVLSQSRRKVFVLHASGHTADELAGILNLKKTSVYCILSQAKKTIRKYMAEQV